LTSVRLRIYLFAISSVNSHHLQVHLHNLYLSRSGGHDSNEEEEQGSDGGDESDEEESNEDEGVLRKRKRRSPVMRGWNTTQG